MSTYNNVSLDGSGIHDGVRYADVAPGLLAHDPGITLYRPAVLPRGYRLIDVERILGHGTDTFTSVCDGLRQWQMHRRAWVRVLAGDGSNAEPVTLGQRVRVTPARGIPRWLRLSGPCMVSAIVDRPGLQWGFAYSTLAGHPECGEESFIISLDSATTNVTARICAVSQPSSRLAKLSGPLGRAEQDRITGRYLDALRALAR